MFYLKVIKLFWIGFKFYCPFL